MLRRRNQGWFTDENRCLCSRRNTMRQVSFKIVKVPKSQDYQADPVFTRFETRVISRRLYLPYLRADWLLFQADPEWNPRSFCM